MRTLLAAAALWAAFAFQGPAHAHGDAAWIMASKWSSCCGPQDCFAVEAVETAGGWVFPHPKTGNLITVPHGQEKPSGEEGFFACFKFGPNGVLTEEVRVWYQHGSPNGPCFFAPPAGF